MPGGDEGAVGVPHLLLKQRPCRRGAGMDERAVSGDAPSGVDARPGGLMPGSGYWVTLALSLLSVGVATVRLHHPGCQLNGLNCLAVRATHSRADEATREQSAKAIRGVRR